MQRASFCSRLPTPLAEGSASARQVFPGQSTLFPNHKARAGGTDTHTCEPFAESHAACALAKTEQFRYYTKITNNWKVTSTLWETSNKLKKHTLTRELNILCNWEGCDCSSEQPNVICCSAEPFGYPTHRQKATQIDTSSLVPSHSFGSGRPPALVSLEPGRSPIGHHWGHTELQEVL